MLLTSTFSLLDVLWRDRCLFEELHGDNAATVRISMVILFFIAYIYELKESRVETRKWRVERGEQREESRVKEEWWKESEEKGEENGEKK